VEMSVVVATYSGLADGLQQLFSIVRENKNCTFAVIVHPDALFRIVWTDQNLVHALEFAVPARPVVHEIALRIHNKNQVLPAIVPALLSLELDMRFARTGHGPDRSVARRNTRHGNR